jgi:histidyl-tRNA synthetase
LVSVRAVKGTKDILPDETASWQRVEGAARTLFARYGYREVRTPIFEETQLFARGIGAETDIVSKEMYTFDDRDGSSLTLRPEATAGIVRAVIEHNLINTDPALKVYAMGPMFRRERPQKGRYRQFHQLDVEAFGYASPSVDAEAIEMALRFLEACGLSRYELVINSVGDAACRPAYVETLRTALRAEIAKLGPDSQRRTETNPLRVLDSKAPEEQDLIATLPKIADHLCADCAAHFAEVRRQLDLLGIEYRVEPRLVRGLDYYVRTTFEVVSGDLGAQNSVLGGGRYDGLVHELGGPDVPGIGWALGLERLLLLVPDEKAPARCDVFLAPLAAAAVDPSLVLQRDLRRKGLTVLLDPEGRSFKSRMKLADKLGARYVAIRGEDEVARGVWSVRDMAGSSQEDLARRATEHTARIARVFARPFRMNQAH